MLAEALGRGGCGRGRRRGRRDRCSRSRCAGRSTRATDCLRREDARRALGARSPCVGLSLLAIGTSVPATHAAPAAAHPGDRDRRLRHRVVRLRAGREALPRPGSRPARRRGRVPRRLVAASCAFQGEAPPTALQVVDTEGRALGPVVVINVGYNDWAAVYDVDRVVRALRSAGVRHVIWVTLREAGTNASIYAQSNARIRSADKRWATTLSVADWNASARKAVVRRGRAPPEPVRGAGPRTAPAPARGRRRRVELASPRLLHSRVEKGWKFALGARVSGLKIPGSLGAVRPQAGIDWERMFCSPCEEGTSRSGWTRPSRTARLLVREPGRDVPRPPRARRRPPERGRPPAEP